MNTKEQMKLRAKLAKEMMFSALGHDIKVIVMTIALVTPIPGIRVFGGILAFMWGFSYCYGWLLIRESEGDNQ